MEPLIGLMQSPPILVGIILFLGLFALVRRLLIHRSGLRRIADMDRRKSGVMPPVPFYDSARTLVTADRRAGQERRQHRGLLLQ